MSLVRVLPLKCAAGAEQGTGGPGRLLDRGGAVVIEGGIGIGKTSLLAEGCVRARRRGWRVLHGCGSALETGFAFGVVRQLFEREQASADPRAAC
jgi:hypothetical protein